MTSQPGFARIAVFALVPDISESFDAEALVVRVDTRAVATRLESGFVMLAEEDKLFKVAHVEQLVVVRFSNSPEIGFEPWINACALRGYGAGTCLNNALGYSGSPDHDSKGCVMDKQSVPRPSETNRLIYSSWQQGSWGTRHSSFVAR